nr:hypothetical protein [Tanacetum cinerariifolium]
GCEALVKQDTPVKLDSISIKYVFVCYPKETTRYYFYYPLENKIFVSQNVEFFENSFMVQEDSRGHRLLKICGSDKGLELIQEEDTQPFENTSEEHTEVAPTEVEPQNVRVPILRSARIPQVPYRYGYYVDIEEYELGDLNEPLSYKVALAYPKSNKWIEAMNMEMQSMKDNQVWYLVDLSSNGRTVGCKWLFEKKTDVDGNAHTFKAHLTAFLNDHLSEDVYMVQPEGFVDPDHPNKVCKLQRFIYGLKQVSRTWNKRFDEEIKKIGEAAYILRIKIIRDRSKRLISLSQSDYLEKILKKFRMKNSKKGYTPIMEKHDYKKSQGAKTPTKNSAKKSTIAMSSTEVEYIVAAEASMEALWMRKFIDGLGDVMPSNKRPMKMLYTNGMFKVLTLKTAEEVVARERKRKARTTLIMALPEDHLAKFHKMADAKEMWEAIKSIFGGNDESKKMQKYLLKQQFKDLSCMPQRVCIKGTTASSSSNIQNVDFMYADNTSSTNDVRTAYSVSSPSVSKSQKEGSSSYTDKVAMISMRIKKFHKRTGRKLQFDTKDPTGFDKTKVECFNCHKIGHFARYYRAKGNQDNRRRDAGYNGNKARDNGRRPTYQDDSKDLVTIDGEDIDWFGHVEEDVQNYAMMAYSSSNLGSDNKTLVDKLDSKLSEYTSCESDSSVETTTSMPAPVENAPKVICAPKVWTNSPIIKEYESDSDDDSVSNVQEDKEKPSFVFTDSVKRVKTSRENDDPHRALKDKRINYSRCSRHMTGNKAHLADYQEFKGGSVAFGGSNRRITAKGKIKAGRLDFEDVYYVEELKHY